MGVGADDPRLHLPLEAVHHRQHHDEGQHAERHAADRDPGDEGEKHPPPVRQEIAAGDEELERARASVHVEDERIRSRGTGVG